MSYLAKEVDESPHAHLFLAPDVNNGDGNDGNGDDDDDDDIDSNGEGNLQAIAENPVAKVQQAFSAFQTAWSTYINDINGKLRRAEGQLNALVRRLAKERPPPPAPQDNAWWCFLNCVHRARLPVLSRDVKQKIYELLLRDESGTFVDSSPLLSRLTLGCPWLPRSFSVDAMHVMLPCLDPRCSTEFPLFVAHPNRPQLISFSKLTYVESVKRHFLSDHKGVPLATFIELRRSQCQSCLQHERRCPSCKGKSTTRSNPMNMMTTFFASPTDYCAECGGAHHQQKFAETTFRFPTDIDWGVEWWNEPDASPDAATAIATE